MDRLFKSEPLIEHMEIAMLLVHLEIADFDTQTYFRDSGDIIHSSGVDGWRDGALRR